MRPTEQYITLQSAYDLFNQDLFGGLLPPCMITFIRKKGCRGYYSPRRFFPRSQDDQNPTDEIALNPDYFSGRTDKEILSTLAHEMAHQKCNVDGHSPRNGYHDKYWGSVMDGIGLVPTTTGEPGGGRTGQRVTHYIAPGGLFDRACDRFLGEGARLVWQSPEMGAADSKPKSKVKFSCVCGQNAWAKPTARLICGDCELPMLSADEGEEED